MKVNKNEARVEFCAEDGDKLVVRYDNRGEPYREGVTLTFAPSDGYGPAVFLDDYEARRLRDMLVALYPYPAAAAGKPVDAAKKLGIGDRVRFNQNLVDPAERDRPVFVRAYKGETGTVIGFDTDQRLRVKSDHHHAEVSAAPDEVEAEAAD